MRRACVVGSPSLLGARARGARAAHGVVPARAPTSCPPRPTRREQADDAHPLVDISEDGRYVAFQTRARNLFADDDPDPPGPFRAGGIFRRDLVTGALELVAYGDLTDARRRGCVAAARRTRRSAPTGATSPSRPPRSWCPRTRTPNVDVYVRDMDQPIGAPGRLRAGLGPRRRRRARHVRLRRRPCGAEITPDARSAPTAEWSCSDHAAPRTCRAADLADRPPGSSSCATCDAQDDHARDAQQGRRLARRGCASAGTLRHDQRGRLDRRRGPGSNAPLQTRFIPGEIRPSAVYYLWRRSRTARGADPADHRRGRPRRPAAAPGLDPSIDDQTATGPCYGPLGTPRDSPPGHSSGSSRR